MKPLCITGIGSISALGGTTDDVIESYQNQSGTSTSVELQNETVPVYALRERENQLLENFLGAHDVNSFFDRVTKLALYAAHMAVTKAGWRVDEISEAAVIVGSGRGATASLEDSLVQFQQKKRVSPYTSPLTTLGGIAGSITTFLGASDISIGTSMTCASFSQALLIAASLIQSGRIRRALVCGAEAPLTPFTIAQMKALRIYADNITEYPCRPLHAGDDTKNLLVLGEGACAICLEEFSEVACNRTIKNPFRLLGIGFSKENSGTQTGMDVQGRGFVTSMKRAMDDADVTELSGVVVHAPGTKLGDTAELTALRDLFSTPPPIYSTKYLTGHTFGSSTALSLELASLILAGVVHPSFPYETIIGSAPSRFSMPTRIAINGAGFGGVISSFIIGHEHTS